MRLSQSVQVAQPLQRFGIKSNEFWHAIQLNTVFITLMVAVLFSAFTIVYFKDLNRRYFIQYQNLQQVRQQYENEWSKLLLEQSTWSTQARIQRIAQQQLNMVYPKQQNIVIIRE